MNPIRYQLGRSIAPSTQPRDKVTPCGRGCCWTPYTCAKQKTCACHSTEPTTTNPKGPNRV
jgi:hypothetical protein